MYQCDMCNKETRGNVIKTVIAGTTLTICIACKEKATHSVVQICPNCLKAQWVNCDWLNDDILVANIPCCKGQKLLGR